MLEVPPPKPHFLQNFYSNRRYRKHKQDLPKIVHFDRFSIYFYLLPLQTTRHLGSCFQRNEPFPAQNRNLEKDRMYYLLSRHHKSIHVQSKIGKRVRMGLAVKKNCVLFRNYRLCWRSLNNYRI